MRTRIFQAVVATIALTCSALPASADIDADGSAYSREFYATPSSPDSADAGSRTPGSASIGAIISSDSPKNYGSLVHEGGQAWRHAGHV